MGLNDLIKDALFPKVCFGCSRLGAYICLTCISRLKFIERDRCPYCKRSSLFGLTHPGCRRHLGLSGLISFFYYDPLLKKIIKNIKYRLVKEAISDLLNSIPSKRLKELLFFKKISKVSQILPVPLHEARLRSRGFNQATELAKFFSSFLNFPILDEAVFRQRFTKPQAELASANDRYKNLIGAFTISKKINSNNIKNKDFIIFDDVWTTGSTIKEVVRVLRRNGANKVFALTIAC